MFCQFFIGAATSIGTQMRKRFETSNQVKVGKARAWEYLDTGSSSSVAPGGCFKEVEIQCILRRVQGESFNVRPLDHDSQTVASRMVGAFDQIFVRTQREREEPDVPTAGFKPVPVLADGFLLLALLLASLPSWGLQPLWTDYLWRPKIKATFG